MGIGREMIDEALLRANGKTPCGTWTAFCGLGVPEGITTIDAARRQGPAGRQQHRDDRAAQCPAARRQRPEGTCSSRNWAAMFDEEGVTYAHKDELFRAAQPRWQPTASRP